MADFKPTPSQRAAIGSRGETVLVSAGAGSGKTRVLTERLIAAVRGPGDSTDIDRFLVITFTRAAAGELKSRITQELAKALAADPGNRRLRRQSALCRKAQIGTIHGFCGALLREYSHVFALPPDFRIIEEERSAAMRASALERTLEQWYERADEHPGFLLLADTAGAGRDDRALSELVLSLHKKMQSHARPELWAAGQAALLQKPWTDAAETPWGRELCAWAADTAALWSGSLDALIAEAQRCGNPKQIEFYTDALGGTADALRELGRAIPLGWDRARACFPIPWADFRGAPRGGDRALAARVSRSRELLKKTLDKLQAAFDAPSDKLLDELRGCAGPMGALLELTLAFDKRYAADKQRQGLADYADLEHMAARLLTNPDGSPTDTARRVAERYDELLVDEYQDVSPVQDAIFSALAACGVRRFLVGDVKQSVYRFRLADPSLFTRRYERYPLDADASSPEAARKILLRENFRSRREIIDGVNAVFSRCMSRALGDLDYDEEAALIFGAQGYTGEVPPPELLLLDLRSGGADDDETPDDLNAEAAFVARSIKKLVEAGTPVQGADGPRPMDYGDAAILLRAANSIGPVYRRALAAEGVPVAAGQGVGYYSSVEISTALSLLAVIDNPHQDIPLIAALRSPVFGFTADELSAIRAADRDADFYTALTAAAANDEKCRAFLARIEPLRSLSADLSAEDLVWELLDGFDLLAIYSAMSDGAQRRLNLLELAELARRFESGGYRGLHRFVRWLRSLAERGEEPAPAGGSGQAVQIWSIHKSKGLEFPVVFLCDQARRFNKRDGSETVPVHPDLGLGPKVVDLERRVSYPSLARRAIARRLEQETLSEELRLLYVALTRAKERLFVTAGLKKPEEALEKLAQPPCGKLPAELLSAQSAPVGWLIAAVLADGERHWRLRVVTPGERGAEEAAGAAAPPPDAEALRELEENLAFRYPHAEAVELPSKLTATGLKGRAEADADAAPLFPPREGDFRMPDFGRKDRPLSGAQRGTATHLLLQYMDFAAGESRKRVEDEIERLRLLKILSDREAGAVDAAAVVRLFTSPLGRRMLRAERLEREFRFSLLCDAGELLGRAPGEQVLLQGVVDCCIEENGALTVIDYKTDAVRGGDAVAERSRLYAGQLRAYALALRRIFGLPVKECVLYFLAAGQAVSLPGCP